MPDVLSVTQISQRIGLSRERIYQLIHDGRFPLPVGEIGQAAVYDETEVRRWARLEGRAWNNQTR